jgi:mannitol/fructose-specific phosphotransferase system IIA component (Ntr-type)
MDSQFHGWLLPSSVTVELEDGSEKDIFSQLIQLLEKTGYVTDRDRVMNDVVAREKIGNTEICDGIIVPHARSTGVTSLCTAAGIINHEKIYVMVVWPENTVPCLKRLSALIEILLNTKTGRALLASNDNTTVYNCLTTNLKQYGITC